MQLQLTEHALSLYSAHTHLYAPACVHICIPAGSMCITLSSLCFSICFSMAPPPLPLFYFQGRVIPLVANVL